MDAASFDRLTQHLGSATTRRGLLRAFVGGLTAAAVGRVLAASETEARQPCSSDLQCPVAERCISGSCVADSDPAALAGRPTGKITLGGPLPASAGCGNWLQSCCDGGYCDGSSLFCNGDNVCQFCFPSFKCGSRACCRPFETCLTNGTCRACGHPTQPCCPGGVCGTLQTFCNGDNVCQFCFPPCGRNTCCSSGQVCRNDVCVNSQPDANTPSPTPAPTASPSAPRQLLPGRWVWFEMCPSPAQW